MQNLLVMTIIGKDRTGLLECIAGLIESHGGNWLESRMCRLGGEFAGILRIRVPKDREKALTKSLQELNAEGLTVIIRPDQRESAMEPHKTALLSLIGDDRPGIIHQISAILANKGVNVVELETEYTSAPMSGEAIFQALARLQIPASCVLAELRKELEMIGSELMVDISFSEA